MFLHSISARKPSPVLTLFQTLFSAPDTCDFTPFSWQRLGAGLLYSAHSQMKEWSLRLSDCPTLGSWQVAEAGFESQQAEPPTAMGTPVWERTPKERTEEAGSPTGLTLAYTSDSLRGIRFLGGSLPGPRPEVLVLWVQGRAWRSASLAKPSKATAVQAAS